MEIVFIRLKLPFGIKLRLYFDELGVQIVEHLIHLEKENWDFSTIKILELKFIQTKLLKNGVDLLKMSSDIKPFVGEPSPLRDCEDGKARSIPTEEWSEEDNKKMFHSWVVIWIQLHHIFKIRRSGQIRNQLLLMNLKMKIMML